jgi:LPS O-antigen subunit length determinant protein (WzzB/FepE family)
MEEKELSIDLKTIWSVLYKARKGILGFSFCSSIIVAIIIFNKPNEYTSSSSVMPELESTSAGGLSKFAGLASLAGLDLSSMASSDAVRPDLYPSIINNTTFFLNLLDSRVRTMESPNELFIEFYINAYDIKRDSLEVKKGILSNLNISPKSDYSNALSMSDSSHSLTYISKFKAEIIRELKNKIVADIDSKSGIINVTVELPDPVAAADVARISMEYLTEFVTNYRIEKSKQDLKFLEGRLEEAKSTFYLTQSKKAVYNDQFQSGTIRLQVADVRRERIESDYRVSSSFYSQLLEQYETAKIKVQENTPVFKMLEMPVVPYKKSGPKRSLLLIGAFVLSFILASMLSLAKNYKVLVN